MGKSVQTKQFIIETTAPVFNRQGYSGPSLSDLTEATGLSKGSIYGNFRDKDEVAIQALKYNISRINDSFEKEKINAVSATAKLMAYPNAYRKMYREILKNGGCPVLNTLTEADDTHEELKRIAVLVIRRWKRDLARIIANGKNLGEFRSCTDENKQANLIVTLMEGGSILTKSTGDDFFIKDALSHVEELITSMRV